MPISILAGSVVMIPMTKPMAFCRTAKACPGGARCLDRVVLPSAHAPEARVSRGWIWLTKPCRASQSSYARDRSPPSAHTPEAGVSRSSKPWRIKPPSCAATSAMPQVGPDQAVSAIDRDVRFIAEGRESDGG